MRRIDNMKREELIEAYNDFIGLEYCEEPISSLPQSGVLGMAFTEVEGSDGIPYSVEVAIDLNAMTLDTLLDGKALEHEFIDSWDELMDIVNGASFDGLYGDAMDVVRKKYPGKFEEA